MASGLTSSMRQHINANKKLDEKLLSFSMLAIVDDCIDTFI
jgi:hypothetical protein